MKYYFTLLLCLAALCKISHGYGQYKPARINDPDGYTNIRSGQGLDFPVVAKVGKEDFFGCEMSDSDWLKVIVMASSEREPIEGYIHSTRVQFVEKLDTRTKQLILIKILERQKSLAAELDRLYSGGDTAYNGIAIERNYYNDFIYRPALDLLPEYFCQYRDKTLLIILLETIWADRNSVDEMPSFTIGECFICLPGVVISQLRQIQDKKQKEALIDHIEHGLRSAFGVGENEITEDKEYYKLKAILDNEKRN